MRLPPELLLQITSYYPLTCSSYEANALATPRLAFERIDTIRALASCSHRMRLCFYPLLWERFYAEPLSSPATSILLATHGVNMPVRRLRRLLLAPHIWPHIRYLSVAFLHADEVDDGTTSALIQILRRLPTLTGLTFSTVLTPQVPLILGGFEQKQFGDVRELAIGHHSLGDIFRSFPNVEKLRIPWGRGLSANCLELAGGWFGRLTWLTFLTLGEPVAATIVTHCPRIRRIDVAACPDRDQLVILRRLPGLEYLSFRFVIADSGSKAAPIITLAKAILRASAAPGVKTVRVDWMESYLLNIVQYSDYHRV
ncbi:hypothetical protein MKEN_00230100 [Mycena kentingensis (nom. inval.)]|nr:hypothetical protein MKEN_00230100 [Mycena kentingensis (nom. inval.)]